MDLVRTRNSTRAHGPGPTRLGAGLLALVALLGLLAGCGRTAQDVSATGGAPGAAASAPPAPVVPVGGDAPLPTLPSAQVREPDRFDAQGCLKTSATGSDCAQQAGQLDAAAAGATTTDWRTLAGFVGKYWNNDHTADAATVLEQTVTARPGASGTWAATGLARNDHSRTLAGLQVEATLRDAGGATIEVVRGTSPVTSVRAGEPVPFSVSSTTTPAAAVASVTWHVTEQDGVTAEEARALELSTYWTRPAGDPRPIDMYLHHDQPGVPPPYLLFGSVVNRGADVRDPRVVVAWVDTAGRVVAVHTASVSDPTGAAATTLAAGAARDVLVAVDDPAEGALADDAAPMLWGVAR